jgi:non-specific serine/threonine protein kinase
LTALPLIPCLTPHGRLVLSPSRDAPVLEPAFGERIKRAFDQGAGHGLWRLGAAEVEQVVPPVFAYWREFAGRFVTALCARPDADESCGEPPSFARRVPSWEGMETLPGFPFQRRVELPPPPEDIKALAAAAPVMPGAEYLTADVLVSLWAEVGAAFLVELAEAKVTVQEFLKSLHPAWNVVGKVHFNLAENRKDEDAPFAFLATYTHRLSAHGKAQHLPLGQALRDYAGAASKEKLLSLLLPVQRAAESCAWLKQMVDAGEIFTTSRAVVQTGRRCASTSRPCSTASAPASTSGPSCSSSCARSTRKH